MSKLYKPSMFNHYTKDPDSNGLILFNSYVGISHLIAITECKKDKVLSWLSQSQLPEDMIENDRDFDKLKQLGYFVEHSINEKFLREVLLAKLKADNTLRLVIHTSKSCNFRCKYCYLYFDNQGEQRINIDHSTQEGIINFVRKNISNTE